MRLIQNILFIVIAFIGLFNHDSIANEFIPIYDDSVSDYFLLTIQFGDAMINNQDHVYKNNFAIAFILNPEGSISFRATNPIDSSQYHYLEFFYWSTSNTCDPLLISSGQMNSCILNPTVHFENKHYQPFVWHHCVIDLTDSDENNLYISDISITHAGKDNAPIRFWLDSISLRAKYPFASIPGDITQNHRIDMIDILHILNYLGAIKE